MSSNSRRKVCVVLVDRANYGRMKPVMRAIAEHPSLQLQVLVAGTMVLERFGTAADVVVRDGFNIDGKIFMELEGSTPATMAKSVGFGIVEFVNEYLRLQPEVILLIGDRYEALSAGVAAAYMNICIAHIQGGEVSGSIDESARHVISKLAQFHFPSTTRSAEFLMRMGEDPTTILAVGCPSSDLARMLNRRLNGDEINDKGSGAEIDLNKPFVLTVFHPTTTEYGDERAQMEELLAALLELELQTVLLWPNIDAGSDHVSKAIRVLRDRHSTGSWLRTLVNLPPELYLKLLATTACAIGNSSSFVRDAGYFGTPVVLVGKRQEGREHDAHLVKVSSARMEISAAVLTQLRHGRYAPSSLYGDGYVSMKIAQRLAELQPYVQKRLHYVQEYESCDRPL